LIFLDRFPAYPLWDRRRAMRGGSLITDEKLIRNRSGLLELATYLKATCERGGLEALKRRVVGARAVLLSQRAKPMVTATRQPNMLASIHIKVII